MMLRNAIVIVAAFALESCATGSESSPPAAGAATAYEVLLEEWSGPHGGVPPFDKIDNALFDPAIDAASERLLAEVDDIAEATEPPTFDNTLVALERSGEPLHRVATLFFTMASSMNTPEIQKLTGVIRPNRDS